MIHLPRSPVYRAFPQFPLLPQFPSCLAPFPVTPVPPLPARLAQLPYLTVPLVTLPCVYARSRLVDVYMRLLRFSSVLFILHLFSYVALVEFLVWLRFTRFTYTRVTLVVGCSSTFIPVFSCTHVAVVTILVGWLRYTLHVGCLFVYVPVRFAFCTFTRFVCVHVWTLRYSSVVGSVAVLHAFVWLQFRLLLLLLVVAVTFVGC